MAAARRKQTAKKLNYLKRVVKGDVISVRECQWKKDIAIWRMQKDPRYKFVEPLNADKKFKMSEDEILKDVRSGKLFALVTVDLHTPEHLKEKFSEMTPIFKHSEITRQDIGEYMLNYAEQFNLLRTKTKSLIGSYWATNYTVSSPLLKWYMEMGIVVTKVYSVVEYIPRKSFKWFVDHNSDLRRQGDEHTASEIVANSAKLRSK